jgi:hypothetical protein
MNIRVDNNSKVDCLFDAATSIMNHDTIDVVLVPNGNMYTPRYTITNANHKKMFEDFASKLSKLNNEELVVLAEKISECFSVSDIYSPKSMVYRAIVNRYSELE